MASSINMEHAQRIARLQRRMARDFDAGDWMLLASYLGDSGRLIDCHPRLLRSLNFGDPDYPSCVSEVLARLAKMGDEALSLVEAILREKGPVNDLNTVGYEISPKIFNVPAEGRDEGLVAAMMPFGEPFAPVRQTLRDACSEVGLSLKATDDIWNNTILVQDIFELIYRSSVVIVDFSGKNPNVMYETGIAHALGKEVIPISQSLEDVPFDLRHHRVLRYLNNGEGRAQLKNSLVERLKTVTNWAYCPF